MARRRSADGLDLKTQAKARTKARHDDAVPEVYHDMLAEAGSSLHSKLGDDGRTVKKRRVGGRLVDSTKPEPENDQDFDGDIKTQAETVMDGMASSKPLQTVDAESGDSTDSDVAWEQVDLKDDLEVDAMNEDEDKMDKSINLVLDPTARPTSRKAIRKKPISAENRKTRLAVHKLHLLCLLFHVYLRNHWCNDEQVQQTLRNLLSKSLVSCLNPAEHKTQFQKDRSFMDGLKQASDLFRNAFHPTAKGMSSSQWAEDGFDPMDINIPADIDLPIDKSDFREFAIKRQGSRDVGQQLFCAMLRSAGVDARLVCSLQPLPFTAQGAGSTPQRPRHSYIIAEEEGELMTSDNDKPFNSNITSFVPPVTSASYSGDAFRIRSKLATRLGRPPPTSIAPVPAPPEPKSELRRNQASTNLMEFTEASARPTYESPFPIYWVEAFNSAIQKWVSVDPLTTNSIARPSKLCPPAHDPDNRLSYVVAFDDDHAVRDVTLRYSQAFNAKTRRLRVESTKGGNRWWERTLRFYRPQCELDRDQVEDAELKAKEAHEPMPRNVADFKNHPYFALERHLKRGEVIHPKRQAGKVNAGTSAETVYRRKDVHVVKSADKWYRLGREIKPGEQPLKRVRARRRANPQSDDDGSSNSDGAGTALYAPFQTQPYIAPPIVSGRVPKNAFGNIDVYVSSMVPPGGIHIPQPETSRAARVLGIDYSDAVTGFDFKGRHGTAIMKGAVIAEEYREALLAVLQGLDDERQQEEEEKRTSEALRMWKRIMTGLKIRQRIEGYQIEGEHCNHYIGNRDNVNDDGQNEADESYNCESEDMAGGFMPNADASPVAEPTAPRYPEKRPVEQYSEQLMLDGTIDGDTEDSYFAKRKYGDMLSGLAHWRERIENQGGGFMIDENDDIEDDNITTGTKAFLRSEGMEQQIGKGPAELSALRDDFQRDPNETNNADGDSGFLTNENLDSPCSEQSKPSNLLSRDELEEAKILQQLHEMEQTSFNARNAEPTNDDLDASPPKDQSIAALEALNSSHHGKDQVGPNDSNHPGLLPELHHRKHPSISTKRARSSSLESKGSLLSCDPAETDAEPDWLD